MMDYFSLEGCGLVPNTEDVEATEGSTTFLYQADDTRYETGFSITVYYSWNNGEANCVENEVLQVASHLDPKTFRNEVCTLPNTAIQPTISRLFWLTDPQQNRSLVACYHG
jgi:hypothetical protein